MRPGSVPNPTESPKGERGVVTEGTVRVGPVMALPLVLAELGADAGPILAESGLALEDFDDSENVLPFPPPPAQ